MTWAALVSKNFLPIQSLVVTSASPAPASSCRPPSQRQQTRTAASAAAGQQGGGKRISQGDFTEKAWEAIISAPEVARGYSQQIVETEHLFKALLEQPNGLARRIMTKAGANPTQVGGGVGLQWEALIA